ncbi:hypothetical protein GOP47_0028930 [Adiantum capillus-veneris]|nr:hypothetical protein GOP47_0028930 [Adiantum capillus-veneris]
MASDPSSNSGSSKFRKSSIRRGSSRKSSLSSHEDELRAIEAARLQPDSKRFWPVLNPSRRFRFSSVRIPTHVIVAALRMRHHGRVQPTDVDALRKVVVRDKNFEALEALQGVAGVAGKLSTSLHKGIPDSPEEVQNRKQTYGENTYPRKAPKRFWTFVWEACHDRTLNILMLCAALALGSGIKSEGAKEGWYEGVSIGAAVLIVIFVTAASDYRQSLQFRKLNEEKENIQIQVIRGGRRFPVSIFDVVVGDVVPLNIGDQIPADGLLISGHSVKVDESSMTGENKLITIDQKNPFLISGCKIADGYGTMIVTAVGTDTEWGELMASISDDRDEETPLQTRLTWVASFIGKIGISVATLVLIILLVYYFTGRITASTKADAQKFKAGRTSANEAVDRVISVIAIAVTIIVVAVPEGLPLAVTLTLAYSMKKMMADKALVRRLAACETMGSATAICSDKTGTLTLNQMNVVKVWIGGVVKDEPAMVKEELGGDDMHRVVLEGIAQNSSGSVFVDKEKGDGQPEFSGSPTEKAALMWGLSMGMDFEKIRASSTIMQVETFNSEKKRAGVAVKEKDLNEKRVHWKGAAEIVLQHCDKLVVGGVSQDLDEGKRTELKQVIEAMAAQSLRCVAFAYRPLVDDEIPEESGWEEWTIPEDGLALLAIVGIKDPCRPGVPGAVRLCQQAGVKVRMVTGDNIVTAKAIATECGILKEGDIALEGATFRAYEHDKRVEILPKLSVMARSSPQDKLILVRTLKDMGEVVAVTGDGTNDAPALHEADIGLSMGIAGTEVAKESSDIIILDDNFETVVKVLRWGRSVFFNVQKFIQFQLTVNVTALIINFVAAVSAGNVPLTAVQLLWVNLIMDTLGALALATEKPSDHLMTLPPAGRTAPIVSNVMWRNLLAQAIYQVSILLTLQFGGKQILGLKGPDSTAVRNTVIFNAFVLCQLFNEVNSRQPERLNVFVNLHLSPLFLTIIAVTLGLQFIIVEFLGKFASTKQLSVKLWLICFGIAFICWPVALVVKLIPVPKKPCLDVIHLGHHKKSSAADDEQMVTNDEKTSSHHHKSPPRVQPAETNV